MVRRRNLATGTAARLRFFAAAATLGTLLGGVSPSPAHAEEAFVLWVAPSTQKVFREDRPSPGARVAVELDAVGGETEAPRSPTPPVTSAAVDSPLENSVPLIAFLICLAFGALGLLAVQAQRRTRRLR